MKNAVVLASMLAMLVFVGPASAVVMFDFGTGDAGRGGIITDLTSSTGSGVGIAIDTLTDVNGDVYDVDGAVNGKGESGVGSLDYDTSTNSFTITGSIVCQVINTICNGSACHAVGDTIVANGVLLKGTGALVLNNDTTSIAGEDSVSFAAGADDKAATLLAAFGVACNPDPANPGFCKGWVHNGFTIGSQIASGNTYNAVSTDIPNSPVPEPASILMLGTLLVGITRVVRQRGKA